MSALIKHSTSSLATGQHTYSPEETQAFSEHINFCLGHDTVLNGRHLPLDSESMDLFSKCEDGLILCKLINLASHDAIDERALNIKKELNIYQKTENQNLALNAAKAIGCQIVNIGSQDIIDGSPTLILGLIWQIIRIQLLSQISLRNFPELVVLLNDGETMAEFMKLHPEVILLRWLNFHLKKAKSSRTANNFSHDLAVGVLSYFCFFCLSYAVSFLSFFCFVTSCVLFSLDFALFLFVSCLIPSTTGFLVSCFPRLFLLIRILKFIVLFLIV
jgi:plastin-1